MTQYFIVGGGDVASIVDDVLSLRKTQSGTYQGILRRQQGRSHFARTDRDLSRAGSTIGRAQQQLCQGR